MCWTRKVALRADALSGPQDRQEATVALRGLIERASCSLPSRAASMTDLLRFVGLA